VVEHLVQFIGQRKVHSLGLFQKLLPGFSWPALLFFMSESGFFFIPQPSLFFLPVSFFFLNHSRLLFFDQLLFLFELDSSLHLSDLFLLLSKLSLSFLALFSLKPRLFFGLSLRFFVCPYLSKFFLLLSSESLSFLLLFCLFESNSFHLLLSSLLFFSFFLSFDSFLLFFLFQHLFLDSYLLVQFLKASVELGSVGLGAYLLWLFLLDVNVH